MILFALKVASSRGMTMLVIFSDALEVVKAAKGEKDWAIEPRVLDILGFR